ncbi:STM3941 family protein [Pedobacter sp. MR2016-24]|uniref:STM3941 family protein n=1 Tax=Pedobacter sp. MR2016-24 TaxID=2994466 RepID=UPI002AFE5FE4|nr:STM3941 family protein [Pedobacter sp. MR2016-24]
MEFYRNKKKSGTIILACVGILILMVLILLYSSGVFSDVYAPKGIALSAIFIVVLGIVITRSLLSINDKTPLISLQPEGIIARVTPMSKAAGLIRWEDIVDYELIKQGWDTLITLHISNSESYRTLITKKLSAMVMEGTTDEHGNLMIYLTASETDCDADVLLEKILAYKNALKV